MTAEEIMYRLGEYWSLRGKVEHKLRHIQGLRLDMMYPAMVQDGMPHGHGSVGMADLMDKIIKAEDELSQLMDAKDTELRWLESIIKPMGDTARAIFRSRYVDGKTWAQVSDDLGISIRQVHRIKKEEIDRMAEE